MKRNRLPSLPDTGRHYLDNTIRARLQSPGIEKYAAPKGRGGRVALAAIAIAALIAAMVWLS